MIELVFPASELEQLRKALAHSWLESAAILLAAPVGRGDRGGHRLLVRDMAIPPEAAYEKRTAMAATLSPAFGLPFEKAAQTNGWSLIYCHTHPCQGGKPSFSTIDTAAEVPLAAYARQRSPQAPHVALLLGKERIVARELGTSNPVHVVEVGRNITCAYIPGENEMALELAHDRQIRAFGEDGQQRLHHLRVVIVGLGGTGSVVAQQLAHLGINEFILIDPDIIDETNLNRVVGAVASDIDVTPKVEVAKRNILSVRPAAHVTTIKADVLRPGLGREIANADFIFSCTDSHGSRHLINQIAYQYLVPAIDMGVSITRLRSSEELALWSHARMLAPGLPCLWCADPLQADQVRRDLMTATERKADPYFNQPGAGVKQPAVISLTSSAASIAVTMFLSAVVGIPAPARFLPYDVSRGRMAPASAQPNANCLYCRRDRWGAGDAFAMPERADV